MTDNKYDKFLEKIVPVSTAIGSLKLHLAETLIEKINEIAASQGTKFNKHDEDNIEKVILDVVRNLPPSYFKIPLDFKPKSESEVQKILNDIGEESIKKILDEIIQESSKKTQTKLF